MRPSEIATRLAPFARVSHEQAQQLAAYLDLLLKWNARINLTAVRRPEEIVARHFGESLFAASHLLDPESDTTACDLGSGAGFPGLPLKIHAPGLRLTLVESQQKKATFLREAVRALALRHVQVFAGRAEEFSDRAELVTLRAVERYERALPVAARLVAPGGRLALLVGAAQAERTPALVPQFTWEPPLAVPQSAARVLLVGRR